MNSIKHGDKMKVDVWTDIVCPFCYIGSTQFNKALDEFAHKDKVEIVHHSFLLQPDAPKKPTGKKAYEELAGRKGESVENMKRMFSSVAESGKQEGLIMKMLETESVSSFDGHRLIHFANQHAKQDEAIRAMFKAYFTDTKDISSQEVLLDIVDSLGLDKVKFKEILSTEELADEVNDDLKKAEAIGVQGVPFFVIDDTFGVSGARGVEAFSTVLDKAWKESHPLHMFTEGEANMCVDESCV